MKKSQTFEQAMNRLEEISRSLESGESSLEESIQLYEEGMKLVEFCQSKLSEAEKKLLKLNRNAQGDLEISSEDDTAFPESDKDK